MISVAFLPVDRVATVWKSFISNSETLNEEEQANNANINYFVNDYFWKNYIGTRQPNGQRKQPRFAITLWNVHESTMAGNVLLCILFAHL